MILRYNIEFNDIEIKRYLELLKFPKTLQSQLGKTPGSFIVNNQIVYNYYQLKQGDVLEIVIPYSPSTSVRAIKEHFEIVYEDSYLLIINKNPNLACLPTNEHYNRSLANHVMAYYKEKGIAANIHFVNRLDAPTTGLVILAKNSYVKYLMTKLDITKKYLLIVDGIMEKSSGDIEVGIIRVEENIILRKVCHKAPIAKTSYRVLRDLENRQSLVEATIHTGKTHQIRVHFQSIGHPLVGDALYGKMDDNRQLMLHSYYLSFIHPITQKKIKIIKYPDWLSPHYLQTLDGQSGRTV